MALYLGSNKYTLYFDNDLCCLNLYSSLEQMFEGIRLLSSDNYILKDINNLYLTVKESE